MKRKISALVKRPGEIPRHVAVSNSLEALQKNVGGKIQTVTLPDNVVVICNEEGRIMNLPYNCTIRGVSLVGTILMVGNGGEDFTDLPMSWKDLQLLYPGLWEGA